MSWYDWIFAHLWYKFAGKLPIEVDVNDAAVTQVKLTEMSQHSKHKSPTPPPPIPPKTNKFCHTKFQAQMLERPPPPLLHEMVMDQRYAITKKF